MHLFRTEVHAGRVGVASGLLIRFHQVRLIVRYEAHLKGFRVGMALHNLLDITPPTIVIFRSMYDESYCSATQGIHNQGLHANHQVSAPWPEAPAASLSFP